MNKNVEVIEYNKKYYQREYNLNNFRKVIWTGLHYRINYLMNFVHENLGEIHQKEIYEHGFGDGVILKRFASDNAVFGTDIIEATIKQGYRIFSHFTKADFRLIEKETIPFRDGQFYISICSHVLEHIENDKVIIKELLRVTKDRGHIIIAIPINEKLHEDPRHIRVYTTSKFIDLLKELNCQIVCYEEYDNYKMFNFLNIWSRYKRKNKLTFPVKILAIFINSFFSLIPYKIMKRLDQFYLNKGITPHQLIILIKK